MDDDGDGFSMFLNDVRLSGYFFVECFECSFGAFFFGSGFSFYSDFGYGIC